MSFLKKPFPTGLLAIIVGALVPDSQRRPAHIVILNQLEELSVEIDIVPNLWEGPRRFIQQNTERRVTIPAKAKLLLSILAKMELAEAEKRAVDEGLLKIVQRLRADRSAYPRGADTNKRRYLRFLMGRIAEYELFVIPPPGRHA